MSNLLRSGTSRLLSQLQRLFFKYLVYLLLFYLFTFLVLAVIRITTGISIKRLGYMCLRDVSFSPKPGVYLSIRAIGVRLRRPTVARSGWGVLYISGLDVTLDPTVIGTSDHDSMNSHSKSSEDQPSEHQQRQKSTEQSDDFEWSLVPPKTRAFYVLRFVLSHARCFELSCNGFSFTLKGIVAGVIGEAHLRIDLRSGSASAVSNRKFVGTLDAYTTRTGEIPAQCKINVSDIYLGPDGTTNLRSEILDSLTLDVNGILGEEDLSYKELSFALRLGKTTIRADKLIRILHALKEARSTPLEKSNLASDSSEKAKNPDITGAIFTESDKKRITSFGTMFVRVVKQVDLKIESFECFDIPVSKEYFTEKGAGTSFAIQVEAVNIDLRRLNPNNPGFKLNFADGDCAHQAVACFSSMSLAMDHNGVFEEVGFVPLISIIAKTNIFSETLRMVANSRKKNQSVFAAGIYVVTPNMNLDADRLPVFRKALTDLMNTFKTNQQTHDNSNTKTVNLEGIEAKFATERLWPHAVIRLSVEEPAARIILPQIDGFSGMVISSATKISCNLDATHIALSGGNSKYEADINLEINGYETWHRSGDGTRHDIILSESFVFKAKVATKPKLSVTSNAKLFNARFLLAKDEVLNNLREVFVNLREGKIKKRRLSLDPDRKPTQQDIREELKASALRLVPGWLSTCKLEIFDITACIATENARAKDNWLRGISLKLVRAVIDYRVDIPLEPPQKSENGEKIKRSRSSKSLSEEGAHSDTDGRRLAIALEGLEVFRVEREFGMDFSAKTRFVDIPGFSLSLTSLTVSSEPSLQLNILMKKALLSFDTNAFFLAMTVVDVMKSAFALDIKLNKAGQVKKRSKLRDTLGIEIKTEMIRLKIALPNSTDTMLETNAFRLSQRNKANPIISAQNIRLYSTHPTVTDAWAIVVTLKGLIGEFPQDKDKNISLKFDAMRMNAPYQFLFHRIFDNSINMVKACLNLLKQYKNHEWDLKLMPTEVPIYPRIPKIRIQTNSFIMTLEDDAFEAELGLIFLTGESYLREKMAKERAFDNKVAAIQQGKAKKPSKMSNDSSTINSGKLGRASTDSTKSPNDTERDSSTKNHRRLPKMRSKPLFGRNHSAPSRHQDMNYEMNSNYIPSQESSISIEEARKKLSENNSATWISMFQYAKASKTKHFKDGMEKIWAKDEIWEDTLKSERIVDYSDDPPLFFWLMKDLDATISNPDMTDRQVRQYMHDIGKGLPLDSRFTIFIPLYLDFKMSEWRNQLRDFPLPFIHIPPLTDEQIRSKKNGELHSTRLKGNFIIAEAYNGHESNIRQIQVPITQSADIKPETEFAHKYIVTVCRTVNSVKIYTDLNIDIYTENPTRITYSNSMQPTLQTAMMAFDSFSKPPLDISPKLGFWDKLRCIFHSRIISQWHKGDVYLLLQGSRSPYGLMGKQSGFVMRWSDHTRLAINEHDDPRRFFVVKSANYTLAIPNYVAPALDYMKSYKMQDYNMFAKWDLSQMKNFKKVVMKLSGKVEWVLGLMFERNNLNELGRTTQFIPHYDIYLSLPSYVDEKSYDAFRGFRSEYIHLAVSVKSSMHDETGYNTAHLSPMVSYYFSQWWSLFDGSLSLPIRQGKLFAPDMGVKPKFGRTLYSVQIGLELSPLFMSHTYRHAYSEEIAKEHHKGACTGLKAKIDSFMLDLHQRREPGPRLEEGQTQAKKRWRMKLNLGELNVKNIDLRVILAEFKEKGAEEILAQRFGTDSASVSSTTTGDATTSYYSGGVDWNNPPPGRFQVTDHDFTWIDFDDYTEVDNPMPIHSIPRIAVLPVLHSPQATYYRQTDNSGSDVGLDEYGNKYKKFGHLLVHDCKIGQGNPEQIQSKLLRDRIAEMEEQLKTDEATLDALKQDLAHFPHESTILEKKSTVEENIQLIKDRRLILIDVLQANGLWHEHDELRYPRETNQVLTRHRTKDSSDVGSLLSDASGGSFHLLNELADLKYSNSGFCNRFIVHNVQLKWNNAIRNAIFRYLQRVSYRRHSVYFTTRKAVNFVEKLMKKRTSNEGKAEETLETHLSPQDIANIAAAVSNDPNCHFEAEIHATNGEERMDKFDELLHSLISTDLDTEDTYLVKLVSPQIQLVSDKNKDQCVLLTAHDMEMKMVTVTDKNFAFDDVSGKVETRYGVRLNDANFFVLDKEDVKKDAVILFSASNYGNERLTVWPPWIAVELCYDSSPLKQSLVVPATNVVVRYDKPNSLYMQRNGSKVSETNGSRVSENNGKTSSKPKTGDASSSEESIDDFCSTTVQKERHRANRVQVDFPKVVVTCDSTQYFAIYTIALDLLIYSEPVSKRHNDKIERLLLAADFGDLTKATKRLTQLQQDVIRLKDFSKDMSIYLAMCDYNEDVTHDQMMLDVEVTQTMLELSLTFSAIKAGLTKGRRDETQFLKWAISSDQIIWHVLDDVRRPFLDIGLADASFNRLQHGNHYNSNTVEVGMMQGFNLSPKAVYPEVLAPFLRDDQEAIDPKVKLVTIKWVMSEPVGGIPIMQLFETITKPLKIQLERSTGEKIFEYLFPNKKDDHDSDDEGTHDDNSDANKAGSDSQSLSSELASVKKNGHGHHHGIGLGFGHHSKNEKNDKRMMSPFVIPPDDASSEFDSDAESLAFSKTFDMDITSLHSSAAVSDQGSVSIGSRLGPPKRPTILSLGKKRHSENKENDDLELMVQRASTYIGIEKLSINKTVLCISYKGSGSRNMTDIHEFVLELPTLHYENKAWSNFDLAMRLKKDVIRILFQHTGALIGNKITKHLKKGKKNHAPLGQIHDYLQFTSISDLAKEHVNSKSSTNVPELTVTHEDGTKEEVDDDGRGLNGESGDWNGENGGAHEDKNGVHEDKNGVHDNGYGNIHGNNNGDSHGNSHDKENTESDKHDDDELEPSRTVKHDNISVDDHIGGGASADDITPVRTRTDVSKINSDTPRANTDASSDIISTHSPLSKLLKKTNSKASNLDSPKLLPKLSRDDQKSVSSNGKKGFFHKLKHRHEW